MAKSINIIFVKQKPDDLMGNLYIRTIENRSSKKKSLKIKVSESDWNNYFNQTAKRFKKHRLFPQYESFNQIIEASLKDLDTHGNEISNMPDEKKSFLGYWKQCIKNESNHGTRIKKETVLGKVQKYLNSIQKSDLLFGEINPMFIRVLQNYFLTCKAPKVLSVNTATHYLKIIQSVINQAISDDYYHYVKHPFHSFSFSKEKKSKAVLQEEEFEKLIIQKIEIKKVREARDMFLFQVFANGMRVSDLFLLRWNNIINERISYTMFKTKTPASIPINITLANILANIIGIPEDYNIYVKNQKISYYDKENDMNYISLERLKMLIDKKVGITDDVEDIQAQYNMGLLKDYKGYKINSKDSELTMLIDLKEKLLEQIEREFIKHVCQEIKAKKHEYAYDFIFPILSNTLFSDIKNNTFANISEEQYKTIKHSTIVYDRRLKSVQKLCGIETSISSHVSRHSFTNLLLRLENVNLYDISQSLGHSSIKITENYIKDGFNIEKIDHINNTISDRFGRKR